MLGGRFEETCWKKSHSSKSMCRSRSRSRSGSADSRSGECKEMEQKRRGASRDVAPVEQA